MCSLYSWSPYMPMLAESLGFVTIPQLWGYNQVSDFQRLVVPGYAQYVLGMNEPNEIGQSNMDAASGVQLWRTYIDPLKDQGYQLISPATSSAPSGKQWMEDFFAACTGCHFDGVALHWYDVKADDFIAYVTDFHDTFNLPVWVTEFACQNFNGGSQPTESEVFAFMNTVTAWMDSTDWVVAYFAFGVMHDMQGVNSASQLMSSSGLPTQLGYDYISS
ncbi:hypothetical protein FISHEDRAFT_41492 [Fistulina hepatica ATCC 64428]|nr:hypothetical protein FISHEDRAFT_41492 [Fistulina hepatica ATCC 64428]